MLRPRHCDKADGGTESVAVCAGSKSAFEASWSVNRISRDMTAGLWRERKQRRKTHMVCRMLPMAEKMVWKRLAMAETMLLRHDATAAGVVTRRPTRQSVKE